MFLTNQAVRRVHSECIRFTKSPHTLVNELVISFSSSTCCEPVFPLNMHLVVDDSRHQD